MCNSILYGYLFPMSATITIPILDIEISINTLITVIILLCIFFTFFSVTIELGGNLSPQYVADDENDCNQIGVNQVADLTTKWKGGVEQVFHEMENVVEGNSDTGAVQTSSS